MSHEVNLDAPRLLPDNPGVQKYVTKRYTGVATPGGSSSISNGARAGAANPTKRRLAKKRF